MIAVIDELSKEIYFISDSVRKMGFSDASKLLQMFHGEMISIVPVQRIPALELVKMLGGEVSAPGNLLSDSDPIVPQPNDRQFLVPSRAAAVIVAGLNPPLMFENGYDYKDISTIKNSYGGSVPHQIEKLISSGKLRYVDSADVAELERKKSDSIKMSNRKHKNGGRKLDSDEESYDDSDDGDRRTRNATRINL